MQDAVSNRRSKPSTLNKLVKEQFGFVLGVRPGNTKKGRRFEI